MCFHVESSCWVPAGPDATRGSHEQTFATPKLAPITQHLSWSKLQQPSDQRNVDEPRTFLPTTALETTRRVHVDTTQRYKPQDCGKLIKATQLRSRQKTRSTTEERIELLDLTGGQGRGCFAPITIAVAIAAAVAIISSRYQQLGILLVHHKTLTSQRLGVKAKSLRTALTRLRHHHRHRRRHHHHRLPRHPASRSVPPLGRQGIHQWPCRNSWPQ